MARAYDPLPCPFCGDASVNVDRADDVFRHVFCLGCGATGPGAGTEDWDAEFGANYRAAAERDAIEAWNAAPRRKGRRVAAHGRKPAR